MTVSSGNICLGTTGLIHYQAIKFAKHNTFTFTIHQGFLSMMKYEKSIGKVTLLSCRKYGWFVFAADLVCEQFAVLLLMIAMPCL